LGVDFVTTCTPTFTKGWDAGLADVQTADLFTDMPTEASRTCRAAATEAVQAGETVFMRLCDAEVSIVRGRTPVGVIRNPPSSLTDRLRAEGGGIATGTITKTYPRSGDFDVRVN
jgi:hypothetical protein